MRFRLVILLSCIGLSACTTQPTARKGVIATTSWTAAYAIAAGASDVSVLAPYEMVHPSEYELRPGDIARLSKTNLIIFAGYEVMVEQLRTGLKIPEEKFIRISTSYNFTEMEESVILIARKLGTEPIARKNLAEIRQLLLDGRDAVQQQGFENKPVLVHFFQESFARELGIHTYTLFGPAPPEPKQILEMAKTNAVLIMDNAHSPVGGSVKEVLKDADYRLLLNFPGLHQTRTLADVIRYNTKQLILQKQ